MTITTPTAPTAPRIAVVIPTYKARRRILGVIGLIGPIITRIYVVDDCCPEGSGDLVEKNCTDDRVVVIRHPVNQGVGGAVMTGYQAAIEDSMDVIVKIDSDGQMDPALIEYFVRPILSGDADYTKGNRFFDLASMESMPLLRIIGNAGLSIATKFSTGYWNIFDPTNGYTAIHSRVAALLPRQRIAKRYFFETDVLYYLSVFRAAVRDVPMRAHYGEEESGLKIRRIVLPFLLQHLSKFVRRILAQYFVRDFSFASLCIATGLPTLLYGLCKGVITWIHALSTGVPTPTGTLMLIALSVIMGGQLLLAFFAADVASVPRGAIHPLLPSRTVTPLRQFSS
jgi:glycosyltransferase involved in cell wall biosynthesis